MRLERSILLRRGVGGFDVDVSDPPVQEAVVELGAELDPVVDLDHLDSEREPGEEVIEELEGGLLVEAGIPSKHRRERPAGGSPEAISPGI